MATFRSHVLVCGGTGCTSGGSDKVLETLREGIKANGLDKEITVVQTGCHGMCEAGPIVIVYPEGTFYTHVKPQDAKEIVAEHLLKGRVVERLLYKEAMHSEAVPHYKELPFYSKQVRLTLRNCGYIDPDSLEEYLARDGYQALAKVLTEKTPEQVVEDIKASGLRGRGGGGFSTGMKWMFCAKSPGPKKYVICNADEGDPGAFMDRSLLEGDPHAILEGMAIGAYAMGADEGYIYCRAEYPLAIKRLLKSITDAEEAGLLGENILGTGFNFTLHVKEGAGAFVCGEETALMNSIEGKRGMPRPRPPFPAIKGLWGKPSNINNVETWANVAQIMFHGPEWYANYGYDKSRGTKVFALTGKVNNTGLVEVPMGTTIREVVFDIGGGIIGGKKFKAVQIGGPSGGCLTEQHLDLPISYESLTAAGAIMGSGGLVVVDEDTCMVDMARFFLEFTQRESCGKRTVQRRHKEDARYSHQDNGSKGRARGPGQAPVSRRADQGNLSVCTWRDGTQSCPDDPEIFQGGVRGAHIRQEVPGWSMPASPELHHRPGKVHRVHEVCEELPCKLHCGQGERAPRDRPDKMHQVRRLHGKLPRGRDF